MDFLQGPLSHSILTLMSQNFLKLILPINSQNYTFNAVKLLSRLVYFCKHLKGWLFLLATNLKYFFYKESESCIP